MPTFNNADVLSLTLDADDVVTFSGTGLATVTPSGRQAYETSLTVGQSIGPVGLAAAVSIKCTSSGSYTTTSSSIRPGFLGTFTGAQITAMNAAIAAGTASYPAGTYLINADLQAEWQISGIGTAAAFAAIGGGSTTVSDLVSSKYGAFFPLNQYNGSGLPRDLSTKSLSLYYMTAMTEALTWGTSGKLTTVAAANQGLVSPVSSQGIDMSVGDTKSMLVFFELTKATPAALEGIMGWAAGASTNNGTANTGVRIYATTSGKLRVEIVDNAGTLTTFAASTPSVADGTPHTCGLYFNGPFNRFELYVDGYFDAAANFGTTVHKTIPQISPFGLGATIGNDTTTVAAQFRGLHIINFSTPPADIGVIVNRLHAAPLQAFREGEI